MWEQNAGLPVILQDGAGNRYVYGLDLLTRISGTSEEWYLTDGLGSTTGIADGSGTVTGSSAYDAFGAVRSQTGATTEWSYAGEQVDATGLQYLRARYYDPGVGRFLSQDPLPLNQRYPYVRSNPANYVDPSGQIPCGPLESVCDRIGDAVTCGLDPVECATDAMIDRLPERTVFSIGDHFQVSLQLAVTCAVQYRVACGAALGSAVVARATTYALYGREAAILEGTTEPGGGKEADAFEHCFWSGLTTLQVGATAAEKILRRYEARPESEPAFRNYDLANNKRGRDFASANGVLGAAGLISHCRGGS